MSMTSTRGNGNGRLLPIVGTLIAILLTALIGLDAYLNERVNQIDTEISALQSQQASTLAMATARLDGLTMTALRIERQVDELSREEKARRR